MLRQGSKSFAAAATLLPRRVRESATVLYAFCRVADDAIDLDPAASEATIAFLRRRLDGVYEGQPTAGIAVDRALSAVVEREGVPRVLLESLIEGMAWDASGRRYDSLTDLYAYATRVAGTVGAMMTVVMRRRSEDVIARACDLGIAMQLTNIARDVGEDARRGRIYLPLAWMREAGLDPEKWLAEPKSNDAIAAVVARLLDAATSLYRRADAGIQELPPNCRTAIRAARLIYADIGREIVRASYDSVNRRAVVSRPRKLWLLARAFASRWTAAGALAPPLDQARFLVQACAERS